MKECNAATEIAYLKQYEGYMGDFRKLDEARYISRGSSKRDV